MQETGVDTLIEVEEEAMDEGSDTILLPGILPRSLVSLLANFLINTYN